VFLQRGFEHVRRSGGISVSDANTILGCRPGVKIIASILTLMQPEPPPAPHPSPAEPLRAPLIARPGRAEEEVAALPIPPDTTDNELVALWLHGKSPNTIRAYSEDVAAFRAFTGKRRRHETEF